MRRLVTMLTVVVLACVGTVPLSCQKPSPLVPPPPWLSGERVEMPEYGFALTVPEGWVAFDTAVDAVSQLEAAAGYVDPDVWSPDDADDADLLTGSTPTTRLMLVDGRNTCVVNSDHGAPTSLDVTADVLASTLAAVRDVQPPERLDLPAGPAYVIRLGVSEPTQVFEVSLFQGSAFVLGEQDSVVLTVVCSNLFTRTDDLWLSIVETIEFLPAEE